jgi:ABC-type lipoprotein export system ATPase subunit
LFVSSIDIKEFRGIAHCKTSLSLSKFTVLIGRNNSGKSSVLEALSLLPNPKCKPDYLRDSKFEFLKKQHGGQSSTIYGYSGTAVLRYTLHDRLWEIKIKDQGEPALVIEGFKGSQWGSDIEKALRKTGLSDRKEAEYKVADEIEGEMSETVFFIPNDTSFIDNLHFILSDERFRNLVTKAGAHVNVTKDIVNRCVDDQYTEILFAPELSARKERGEGKPPFYVKVKDLGDGIQKAVLTALWLEALNPSLVLWDDFEGSAHPTLIKVLLEWLSKKPWQVIMSTHSFDVLNGLLDVRPKDTKVVMLKKTNDDVLLHEDLTLEQLEDIVETSQDPRRLVDALKL